jgi:hypothetical protein
VRNSDLNKKAQKLKTLRIQTIILILITNFALGQNSKITIDKNISKYEIKDEYNRFDDIANEIKHIESLKIEKKGENEIKISNSYSSGFTGNNITFRINRNLEIKNVTYSYWTDVLDSKNKISYKIKKTSLKLNQNPFNKTNGLRGMYILEIEHFWNNSLTKTETFKGKFKTFKGINETSEDYLWTLNQNRIFYGITNEDGVYLHPDKMPSLKSNSKVLTLELKKIKDYKFKKIKAFVVINETGKIEMESIRFSESLDKELEKHLSKLLVELTEWYPACVNEKEVKSQIPVLFAID